MMIDNKTRLMCIMAVFAAFAVLAAAGVAYAASKRDFSHMNRTVNVEGCAACHAGRGVFGGGMLKSRIERLCYRCHSFNSTGKGRAGSDIESVMRKISRHPVEDTSHLHRKDEVLPAQSPLDSRHVACSDCHLVHVTTQGRAWNGMPGYRPSYLRGVGKGSKPSGVNIRVAEFEYELCYRCHSDGADLGLDTRNISLELDPSNMSYHPVEISGRNKYVPSLVQGLSEASVITCGSCHGNSDPTGPAGPHGSDYAPLLIAEYRTGDGPESSMSYTLCYICHDRTSILADESFKSHRNHIALQNLSCKNCHNAHGSRTNSHLIEFDGTGVSNASDGMGPLYMLGAPGTPKCFLNCHGADHNTSSINGMPWPW